MPAGVSHELRQPGSSFAVPPISLPSPKEAAGKKEAGKKEGGKKEGEPLCMLSLHRHYADADEMLPLEVATSSHLPSSPLTSPHLPSPPLTRSVAAGASLLLCL